MSVRVHAGRGAVDLRLQTGGTVEIWGKSAGMLQGTTAVDCINWYCQWLQIVFHSPFRKRP